MPNILRFTSLILTVAIILMTVRAASAFAGSQGVIVLEIDADSPAMKAGLKVGDLLLSYDDRPLPSPAALQAALQNITGKKEIMLRVRRGGETLTVTIPAGRLGAVVLSDLPVALALDKEIGDRIPKEKIEEAASKMMLMAKEAREGGDKATASYVYEHLGHIYEQVQKWKEARKAYMDGWELMEGNGDAAAQAKMLEGISRCSQGLKNYPEARLWFEKAINVSRNAGNEIWAAGHMTDIGSFAQMRGEFQDAYRYHSEALKIVERLRPDSLNVAATLNNLGNAAVYLDNIEAAENDHLRALKICDQYPAYPLYKAVTLNNLGNIAVMRERLPAAEAYYRDAQALFDKLPPDAPRKAANLIGLGNLAQMRGDLQAAQDYYQQALKINQLSASKNSGDVTVLLDLAGSFNNLGNVAYLRGELETAKDYHDKALKIRNEFALNPLDVAASQSSLGNVALAYGDFQTAEKSYRAALDIEKRFGETSLGVAGSFNNLGNVAEMRRDLQAAQEYYNNALEIRRKRKPGSLDVATILNNLGNVAFLNQDFKGAEDRYSEALNIKQEKVPGTLDVAISLNNLGNVRSVLDDPQKAQEYYNQALAIYARRAPGSLDMAMSLNNLGNVSRIKDLKSAQDYYFRALAIQKKLAPGSLDMANTLNNLGLIALDERHLPEALRYFKEAVDIIEAQRGKIFSFDNRAFFMAGHQWEYYGLLRTYIALNDFSAAFATVERARARSLLDLISARKSEQKSEQKIDSSNEASIFIERQKKINYERSGAYYTLKQSNAAEANSITTQQDKLTRLNIQQRELEADIRRSASERLPDLQKFANLQYPKPLDLKGAQEVLDPGTLLLTYFVGYKESYLFAVTKTEFNMFTLSFGEKEIYEQVREFRDEVSRSRPGMNNPGRLMKATIAGKQLYDELFGRAQTMVDHAKRILICPDGPLHALPFGALVSKDGAQPRYLIEDKPLHTIVSMAVYKEVKQQTENKPEPKRLLAFGYPLYSKEQAAAEKQELKQSAQQPGSRKKDAAKGQAGKADLPPLPGTLVEVREISKLFEKSKIYVGEKATESAAKAEIPNYTILHFAVHGLLDDQNGLDSSLALSLPEALGLQATEKDNGYLQAWEIFEQPKLKADLVVLSACEVGLGRNISGEGMVGLTRAFQYAGAKSIAISLWKVGDRSAVVFMTAFYQEIRNGVSKDVALQRATAAVRSHPDWRHPYYWAHFFLTGDWQ